MKRNTQLLLAAVSTIVALAVVPLTAAASAQRTATTTVSVKAGEMYFKLSTKTLAKPGKVTFVVTNAGHLVHDFTIGGKTTPLLQPGKTARLVITFKKKGNYPYLCTVPGHAAAGMKGTFTVH
ncbi:MAG: plastocyanin/azurin family copper-binding protein [Actinomycetota bacterium]|nr:plastocyanin/azurin family copper-binding protein [Actinomycetota bacterium]